MTLVFLVSALGRGGAEKQMLLIARALGASGQACEIYSLGRLNASGHHSDLLDACRAAGVRFVAPTGLVSSFVNMIELMVFMLRGRSRRTIWTWGYRAEFIRVLLCPYARGIFSIRSASESQAYRWRWLLRVGRPVTWRYISNSHLGVKFADRVAPGIAAKACVVPNALESTLLKAAAVLDERPEVLNVLMLGNVRYAVKGYDLALHVGQRIRDAGLPIRICIGGAQYAGEPDLQEEIRKSGLTDILGWAGPISDSLGFLQKGQAFMLLSRYEGMPNALFEAMAVGLPCVATDVGDLRRYANESNGLKIIPLDDANSAFQQLCWIWNNWDDAVAMGRRAQRFCRERFSEERMIADLIAALELKPSVPAVASKS